MSAIITPVILVVVVGAIAAVILTLAAKFMAVPVDETAVAVREVLPGANCGACGYAGCDDYAAALAANPKEVAPNLCIPGGAGTSGKISQILGVDAGSSVPVVARVRCSGISEKTKEDMEYQGFKSCQANKLFFNGHGACKFGCMGYGDCVAACKFDAIHICNGVAVVDREACVGCGACAKACPNQLIEIVPQTARVFVGCSSCDTGKETRAVCEVGCIACKICEKECKFDAIHVENNHAVIDPEKCKNCGMCAKKCPRNIIHIIPKPGAKPAPAKPAAPKAEAKPAAETAKAEIPKAETKPAAEKAKAETKPAAETAKAEAAKTEVKKAEAKAEAPNAEDVRKAAKAEAPEKKTSEAAAPEASAETK